MLAKMFARLGARARRGGVARRGRLSRRTGGFGLECQAVTAVHRKHFRRRQHLRFETHIMAAVGVMFIPGDKKVLAAPAVWSLFSHDLGLSNTRGRPSSRLLPEMPPQ